MKPFATAALAAAFALGLPSWGHAQDAATAAPVQPRFLALPAHRVPGVEFAPHAASAQLAQWNGSFTDRTGVARSFTMVGADPSTSDATTTVTVYLVPVKMVYGATNGNRSFDPRTDTVPGGKTVMQNIQASPLFNASVDFVQGGTDLGTAQYIDAYQRGNFWQWVKGHAGYHTVMAVKVLAGRTLHVSPAQGKVVQNVITPGYRGLMDVNAFDAKVQKFLAGMHKVDPSALPVFITDDVFLTSKGSCCIGGYHSATAGQPGGQTYAHASYINSAGSFGQDVSALSHELGEWMDDPFVDNQVGCGDNQILENGDPIEGDANYGDFKYTVGGFAYNLQSLVYLPYFGAPRSTSVNQWISFQNDKTNLCPGQ